jgi:hypothetical protein
MNLQGRKIPTQVDRIATAARRFSANGAIAKIERVRMQGTKSEMHTTAMT